MKNKVTIFIIIILSLAISIIAFRAYYNYKKTVLIPSLPKIDYILVEKGKRLMSIYNQSRLIKQYKIVLGPNSLGHKLQEGDGKTPEGKYEIVYKNPRSKYHLSLKISYPNESDKENAKQRGVAPGDHIMIHGIGIEGNLKPFKDYYASKDWTEGCIAVTNEEIEEIYSSTEVGTPIEIRP